MADQLEPSPFVGRDAELKRLLAVARDGGVAFVAGEAGVGKSRLVHEFCIAFEDDPAKVVVGLCRRIREPFPLGPVVEVARQLHGELARANLSPVTGVLRRLVPELSDVLPPAPEVEGGASERHQVFRALTEVLGSVGRVVIVIEDLHWADSQTLEFTMYDTAADELGNQRWLIGEDSWAFGQEIRDMWTPTCLGSPGKVSDAEYWCASSDNGGVHFNSGVPNHGYALLVDGGDYNGVTVPWIGLTKAAHIYYRAMTNYQTTTTDFTAHADALEASCSDLVGQPLNALSTTADDSHVSDEVIAEADCAAVTAMAEAVELRTEPVQCNFQPALDPDAPPLCADPEHRTEVYSEGFDSGLGNWTNEFRDAPDPAGHVLWEATDTLPDERPGSGAFAPDPVAGECGAEGDMSGVSMLTSDVITLPEGGTAGMLAFDHYFATEAGYDGGNVKISVNGGQYLPVAASALTFNGYDTALVDARRGNTNPLAGEQAFNGTNGGSFVGSWGQTQIDLATLRIVGGDRVRVRFEFGRDGCNGNDGWYIDNVEVTVCMGPTEVEATAPKHTRTGSSAVVDVLVTDTADDHPTGTVQIREKRRPCR